MPPVASGNVQRAEPESRLDIDTSRVKTFEEFSEIPMQRVKSSSRPKEEVDRIALLRHGIPDLRLLYGADLRFLEQFPGGR